MVPPDNSTDSLTEHTEPQTEITPEEEDQLLTWTYSVPFHKIYVDFPNYKLLEAGFTRLLVDGDNKCLAFRYEDGAVVADLEESYEVNLNGFIRELSLYYLSNEAEDFSGERVSVNGIDCYKAVGKIKFGSGDLYDAYTVVYAFITDNTPCAVFGVVMDKGQPDSEIAAVNEITEAMVHTVRNQK